MTDNNVNILGLNAQVSSSSLAPKVKKSNASTGGGESYTLTVTAETWRFYAYLAFWSMCLFAITLTKLIVAPILAKGPADGSSCGPYNRNDPDFGVFYGKGFDITTQSHLVQLFGFGNICTNWDYTPSRELTSIVYPLFEYSLLVYLVFDFMATALANKRGELEPWFWKLSKILFPLNILLCSQFRQIFVNLAYENVRGHTAGFLGLQIALIIVALQNVWFIYDTNTAYKQLGSTHEARLKNTRMLALAYVICDLIICSFKITATIYVVSEGHGAPWTLKPSFLPGKCVGQVVDIIWMIFNALIPLFVSNFRSKNEVPLKIVISQDAAPYIEASAAGENAPLTGGTAYKLF